MTRIDPFIARLSQLAAELDDPDEDWQVNVYADFAQARAATPNEYATPADAFHAAEALMGELLGSDYVIINFARIRVERNDAKTGTALWRGYLHFGVQASQAS